MKTCTKCGEHKTLEEFHRHKGEPDGRQWHCKVCRNGYNRDNREKYSEYQRSYVKANKEKKVAYHKAYYAATKEKRAEYQKAWRASNKEKRRDAKRRHRANKACAVPQPWKKSECPETLCYWCGVDLSTVKVELEHLMPISLGGEAKPYNEAPACRDCNRSKKDKHPLVWIASLV